MGIFHGEDLDAAVAQELFDDIDDHYRISEHALIMLDREPRDSEQINALFRSVHTIKGDLGIVGFSPAIPLISAIEDLLSVLRSGSFSFSPVVSDLMLLVLDRVRGMVDRYRSRGFVEYDASQVASLGGSISALAKTDDVQRDAQAAAIIRQLDPSVLVAEPPITVAGADGEMFETADLDSDPDLVFFRQLIEPVETRSRYWLGRSDRILKLSLILNRLGDSPVDETQLAAAVYAHDFGMAFMPLELLHKEGILSNAEIQLLRSHVQSSAQLLQHMDKWAAAREIVLQHHEAANGSGYPCGLREQEICPGAKILAIADTFDAMTHHRAHIAHQKRPIIRAVKEINELSGHQLSPTWVEIFNQAVQPVLIAHGAKHL